MQLPLTEFRWSEENAVERIFYGRVPISKAVSLLFYVEQGISQRLIHALKYKGQEEISLVLGHWLGTALQKAGAAPEVDLVIPVPLHTARQRQRGYNQVHGFGRVLATYLQAEFAPHLLRRSRSRKTQTRKGREDRLLNQRNSLRLNDHRSLEGRQVLLVDDVITTGATLEACTLELLAGNPKAIHIATMAVVP